MGIGNYLPMPFVTDGFQERQYVYTITCNACDMTAIFLRTAIGYQCQSPTWHALKQGVYFYIFHCYLEHVRACHFSVHVHSMTFLC